LLLLCWVASVTAAFRIPNPTDGVQFPSGPPIIVVDKRKNKMYIVVCEEKELYSAKTLDEAMVFAKVLEEFVTIKGKDFEVCGKFGVDTVSNGKCPDGVLYDWNKSSRIGAEKRRK
jgi:hypothetical protein